jgi:hypothetical protein
MNKLYSIRDCGRLLGIAPHKIAYAHSQDRLAEPNLRVAGKRIYTWDDCRRVAAYFNVPINDQPEVTCGK